MRQSPVLVFLLAAAGSALQPPTAGVQRARPLKRVDRNPRLPVWPAWNGLVWALLSALGQRELAAKGESTFGGRVCPISLDEAEADPFVLVVHHRHAFHQLDPLRAAFRALLPEGFPAHPHRGFETLTYVLPGKRGLVHRDSIGVKMRYNDGECQWFSAARGALHEEMWETDLTDDPADRGGDGHDSGGAQPVGTRRFPASLPWPSVSEAELYQIWLNLPPESKLADPRIQLLRPRPEHDPRAALRMPPPDSVHVVDLPVVHPSPGVEVRVVAGDPGLGLERCNVATYSDVAVMHATLKPGAKWALPLPESFNVMCYVRQGDKLTTPASPAQPLAVHEMAFFAKADGADGIVLDNAADASNEADVLLLAGQPIGAPVAQQGSMVMNDARELQEAYDDFARGTFGVPWDHRLSDDEWRVHLKRGGRAR